MKSITKPNWRRAWNGRILHYVVDAGTAVCGLRPVAWDIHIYTLPNYYPLCKKCKGKSAKNE
jgi:hypothetical protein